MLGRHFLLRDVGSRVAVSRKRCSEVAFSLTDGPFGQVFVRPADANDTLHDSIKGTETLKPL